MNIILSLILILLVFSSVFAEEPYTLEKIVVKPSGGNNYPVQIITSEEIEGKGIDNIIDVLDHVSGMDLRCRGPQGIQGDLSLQGSTYEQIAVLIDGVKVNDPQTGHHNLDIPLTLFDIEKIEVTKNGASSFYGSGAFAGSLNIITKKPDKKKVNFETLAGEHALFGNVFSYSFPKDDFTGRFSFGHKVSKAARANTDFEYKDTSCYLSKDFGNNSVDALLGYQKKDFGADSFYSNLFTEEEEHTETFFVRTGLDSMAGFGALKNNLFLRKHRDKFILRRNNPTSVNYHTTYVYGANSDFSLPVNFGDVLFGIDAGEDEIYSTNLGKHRRFHEALAVGFIPELNDKVTLDFRLRLDDYQAFDAQESFNLGLSYLVYDNLKIQGSAARAFRVPSFTELYYSDSANNGNSGLKVEESDNFNLGCNFTQRKLELGIEGFLRKGKNLIDWTRESDRDVWQATNLGKVDFRGLKFSLSLRPDLYLKGLNLKKAIFSYSYTDAQRKTAGFLSKYALDILRHQFTFGIDSILLGINFDWQFSYNERNYGEIYFLGDLNISKRFAGKDFVLEPFIKIDNFSNTEYTEVAGVLQPGRWVKAGLKFEW